jgi:NAD(P)-dependent dehydrogenase (short-subunit alcohol dehydrogenase family)
LGDKSEEGEGMPGGTAARGVAVVIGAGEGTGRAISRRFARAGHPVCAVRRDLERVTQLARDIEAEGGRARGFAVDARSEEQVIDLFDRIEAEVGDVEVVVFNAAIGTMASIMDLSAEAFRDVWETDCFAAFLCGREAARRMTPRKRGTILFTGATSALRGKAGFAAFAAAKHGQRALAQSMARELGPKGVHVAHIVIDGPIDGEFVRNNLAELVSSRPDDGILSPDDIAETFYEIHRQGRSAWTHELELRPWVEPW